MKVPCDYIELKPALENQTECFIDYCKSLYKTITPRLNIKRDLYLNQLRNELLSECSDLVTHDMLKLKFTKSVLLDLLAVGWKLQVKKNKVFISVPQNSELSHEEIKETVRKSHLIERNAQLNQNSVREFIKRMERRRLTSKGWHSIFSVMRNGKDLARKLDDIKNINDQNEQTQIISKIISPYIQLANENSYCDHTGLPLQHIWRYFRHTWITSYKSTPGRTMMLLIRDAAAPNHPVIGIAALGSSIIKQKIRDSWIGWDEEKLIEEMISNPSAKYGKWLLHSLSEQITNIYVDDLYKEGICHSSEIDNPSDRVIQKLTNAAKAAVEQHVLFPQAAELKSQQVSSQNGINWEKQSQTKLFKSKRCRTLASLLRIRQGFQTRNFKTGTKKELEALIKDSKARTYIKQLIKMIRATHIGTNMMDIIVCGAVAPYNHLLGGKLVSMMLTSPEIVKLYAKKYRKYFSIIASSMKGHPVVRQPNLVLLSTTSLFGVGSSQYNKIKIPCEEIGGKPGHFIEYKNLGKSEGYGSYHFGETTLKLLQIMLGRAKNGRKVNSIFGEGVNPRMRKIREGLNYVNLPSDKLLVHGNSRVIYTIALARNFRDILLGLSNKPSYLLSLSNAKKHSSLIATYWTKRWLLGRITRPNVLEQVSMHTLSYPISHGARVLQPPIEENHRLFEP